MILIGKLLVLVLWLGTPLAFKKDNKCTSVLENHVLSPINISAWTKYELFSDEEREIVSRAWDEALTCFGFVIITGHNISSGIISKTRHESLSFFEKPLEEKKFHTFSEKYGSPSGGYNPIGNEAVSRSLSDNLSDMPDSVESFVFRNYPSTYKSPNHTFLSDIEATDIYFRQIETLVHNLHRISALALGLDDIDFFKSFFTDDSDGTPGSAADSCGDKTETSIVSPYIQHQHFGTLKLSYYPAFSHAENQDNLSNTTRMRYGAHTDYVTFTVLSPDPYDWRERESGGLEVRLSYTEQWIPVNTSDIIESFSPSFFSRECFMNSSESRNRDMIPCQDGGMTPTEDRDPHTDWLPLVINAGDLTHLWTNGRWHSPLHRVVSPSDRSPASRRARLSLVFFTGPVGNPLITPLSNQGAPRYKPVRSMDHLLMKLQRSRT